MINPDLSGFDLIIPRMRHRSPISEGVSPVWGEDRVVDGNYIKFYPNTGIIAHKDARIDFRENVWKVNPNDINYVLMRQYQPVIPIEPWLDSDRPLTLWERFKQFIRRY